MLRLKDNAKTPHCFLKKDHPGIAKGRFYIRTKRGKGSHLAFVRKDKERTRLVIVPDKKEIPKGTLLSILEPAGLSKEEFVGLLKD